MKIILLIFSQTIEDEVMEALEKTGMDKYTEFRGLLGRGGNSEPHLDTAIWPGTNSMLLISAEEAKINKLLVEVKELKKEFGHVGIKAFVLPVEEII